MSKRDEAIAIYEATIDKFPDVQRKGAANPYTSHNGNMFSFVGKDGKVALRLPAEQRDAFCKKHQTKLAVAYETVMKEYVSVPDAVLRNARLMKKYFADSVAYVRSLPAKATTKPNKTKPNKKKAAKK